MNEAVDHEALPVPAEDVEVVDAQSADLLAPGRRAAAKLPAVQAAAAAAGGFVAGAAVVGLMERRRRRSRPLGRGRGSRRRTAGKGAMPAELLQIVGSRSLLLDVHLLGGAER